MSESINYIKKQIIKAGFAVPSELEPCTEEDIAKIERKFRVQLPRSYKAFLSCMGRNAGRFLRGTSIFYPEILELRDYATDLISETGSNFQLTEYDFIFMVHQGYQFAFFHTGEEVEPPVFYFIEGAERPEKNGTHLSII